MSDSTISEPPTLEKEAASTELPVELPVYTWEELEEHNNYSPKELKELPVVRGKRYINKSIFWASSDYSNYIRTMSGVVWQCYSVEQHYFEQAKALKDDPDKQPEFQALRLKAD